MIPKGARITDRIMCEALDCTKPPVWLYRGRVVVFDRIMTFRFCDSHRQWAREYLEAAGIDRPILTKIA